jgi:hypothetical protein
VSRAWLIGNALWLQAGWWACVLGAQQRWLLLAVVVVWVIRALKTPDGNAFRDNNRWRY